MDALRPMTHDPSPVGQRSPNAWGRSRSGPAFDPHWMDDPNDTTDDSANPDGTPDADVQRMSLALLAAIEAPPLPRMPKIAVADYPFHVTPSVSADRAPSPPAADPLLRVRSTPAVHANVPRAPEQPADPSALVRASPVPTAPNAQVPGGNLPASASGPPETADGGFTPLLPDRREQVPASERDTFTPLSPERVAGPPRREAAPGPVPRSTTPNPPENVRPGPPRAAEPPKPVLEPLVRELARLVFTAATVRESPPARAGGLRSISPKPREPVSTEAPPTPRASEPSVEAPTAPQAPPAGAETAEVDAPRGDPAPVPIPRPQTTILLRESARPVSPPASDEPLPPPTLSTHTRVHLDAELSVDVSATGNKVDVALHGSPSALDPLRSLGPDIDSTLASSGFSLGRFLAHDEGASEDPDAQPEETDPVHDPTAPITTRRGSSRIRRYA